MISLEMKGADLLVAKSQTFQKRLPAAVLNGIRGQVRKTITKVRRQIRTESGIGRSKWSRARPGWIDRQVNLLRARIGSDGKSVETGIKLSGMPRIIEVGGRLKPHKIEGNPWLVFKAKDGRLVSLHRVNHPGAPVRAHSYARKALDQDANLINVEVAKRIDKLTEAVFGKSA